MSLQARLQDQALSRRLATPPRCLGGDAGARRSVGPPMVRCGQAAGEPGAARSGRTLALEWPSGRVVSEQGTARARHAGAAGLGGQGVRAGRRRSSAAWSPRPTSHMCRRVATADGRRFVCSHPDLKRPLSRGRSAGLLLQRLLRAAGRAAAARGAERRAPAGRARGDCRRHAVGLGGASGWPARRPRRARLLRAVARVAGVGPDAVVACRPARVRCCATACAAPSSTARPTRSAAGAPTRSPRPGRRRCRVAGRWAWSSPSRRPARRRARRSWSRLAAPASTPRTSPATCWRPHLTPPPSSHRLSAIPQPPPVTSGVAVGRGRAGAGGVRPRRFRRSPTRRCARRATAARCASASPARTDGCGSRRSPPRSTSRGSSPA